MAKDNENDNKNSKVGKVTSTSATERVKKATAVDAVEKVKGAGAVAGVGGIQAPSARRATRLMSAEEREKYMQIITEEAKTLFKDKLPKDKLAQVENAVKMAIDAGLMPKDDQSK
jgi:hypothetical protein